MVKETVYLDHKTGNLNEAFKVSEERRELICKWLMDYTGCGLMHSEVAQLIINNDEFSMLEKFYAVFLCGSNAGVRFLLEDALGDLFDKGRLM